MLEFLVEVPYCILTCKLNDKGPHEAQKDFVKAVIEMTCNILNARAMLGDGSMRFTDTTKCWICNLKVNWARATRIEANVSVHHANDSNSIVRH
jgi:hypothetical protein